MTRDAESTMQIRVTGTRRNWTRAGMVGAAVAVSLTAAAGIAVASRVQDGPPERQADVAIVGAQVMPFDVNRTTHVFTDLTDGGRQAVTADDPGDQEQIALIQQHLAAEADRFRIGDFDDPAAIHGQTMPGLAELRDATGRIEVVYEELDDGAQLVYRTTDGALIEAIHAWFAAQRGDHGGHQG